MEPSTSDLTQIRQSLARSLLPAEIAVCVRDIQSPHPDLFAAEEAGLSPRAVEKRRREFTAGRAAARQAMAERNHPPVAIPVGPNRAPCWPSEIIGSISHTNNCAIAAVSETSSFGGIGIDVEEDTPLKPDLWNAICSAQEQGWMREQDNPGQMGKLIFSAKEAAYKCQYAQSQRFFGFDGMELEFDQSTNRFLARFTADQPPFDAGYEIAGTYAIGAGVIITAATLPQTAMPPQRGTAS